MLSIFREIRKSRIQSEGTSKGFSLNGKYLVYALGEIVLVVVGILIALQVNNWNENRKSNASRHTGAFLSTGAVSICNPRFRAEDLQPKSPVIIAFHRSINWRTAYLMRLDKKPQNAENLLELIAMS